MKRLLLIATILLAPQFARGGNETLLYENSVSWLKFEKDRPFVVELNDNVTGDCWTNPKAVQNAVKLELKRSGYKITENFSIQPIPVWISIEATGTKSGNALCVAAYNFYVRVVESHQTTVAGYRARSVGYRMVWKSGGVMAGDRNHINSGLRENFVSTIQEFILAIDENRAAVVEELREEATGDAKVFWDRYKP